MEGMAKKFIERNWMWISARRWLLAIMSANYFLPAAILLEFYSCIVRYALSVEVLILHFIPLLGRTIFLNKFGRFLLFDWFFMFGIKCILFQHMLLLPFPFLTLQTILSPLGFFTKKSL